MDHLLKLIETLRERIGSHQPELSRNEALTRSVLIDPLLRALDWDIEDPKQVIPEFRVPETNKPADYALFVGGAEPVVIVEAKKLGEPLGDAADQALGYCNRRGYKHFAVTDGSKWLLYETHRPVELDRKIVVTFDLGKGTRSDVCLKALYLWKQRFIEGTPVSFVAAPAPSAKAMADMHRPQQPITDATSQGNQSSDWMPLSKLTPEGGETPLELLLPSGDILGVTSWAHLVAKLTQWLVDHGDLVKANLPVRTGGKRFLVAEEQKHSDGKAFRSGKRVGQFFVETGFSASAHANNMRTIINSAGQQADDFKLRTRKSDQGGQT